MVNLKSLSFLIASFDDIVNTFGLNEKSAKFFKKQVLNLQSIGQVNMDTINALYRVFNVEDLEFGDKRKVDRELEKKDFFVDVVNKMLSCENNVSAMQYVLLEAEKGKEFPDIIDLVCDIFEIAKPQVVGNKNNNSYGFGTMDFNQIPDNRIKNASVARMDYDQFLYALNKFDFNKKLCVRVKNLDAVCTCDLSYYTDSIESVFPKTLDVDKKTKNNSPDYSKFERLVSLYSRGAFVSVGELKSKYNSNSCSTDYTWNEHKEATKLLISYLEFAKKTCDFSRA